MQAAPPVTAFLNVPFFIDAPANVTVTATSDTSVSLSWTAAAGSVDHYQIERCQTISGPFAFLANASGTTFNDATVTVDYTYLYRVRTVAIGGALSAPNEDLEEWSKRYAAQFQQAMPAQPMLARIYDRFNYVSYAPDEIEQLRVECVELEANILNEKARSGLKKLIAACNEASRLRVGLLFVPD